MSKITLEEFRFLKNCNDDERDTYDHIHCKIIDRIDYILSLCCSNTDVAYWDCPDNKYKCFDSYEESDNLILDGNFELHNPLKYIPIRWLWEDFEEELAYMIISTWR